MIFFFSVRKYCFVPRVVTFSRAVYFETQRTDRERRGHASTRFKVNFKNVFVGDPGRKSLPTARFCNPRTLICWQDGLKSVDPAGSPEGLLVFSQVIWEESGKWRGTCRSNFTLPSKHEGRHRPHNCVSSDFSNIDFSISPRVRPTFVNHRSLRSFPSNALVSRCHRVLGFCPSSRRRQTFPLLPPIHLYGMSLHR